jgi:type IX secretion system PorP/SprF family membrane protein
MKHFLLTVLLALLFTSSYSQIDPLYAQYLNNPVLINPAYTGINNNFTASVSYRKQWAGFDGNPVTANLNGQISLLANRLGLGIIVLEDRIGNNHNTEVYTTYSYKIEANSGSVLSFGLQAGFINYRSNTDHLNAYDITDPAFNANQSLTRASFGAGIIFKTESLFIGLSVPRMLKQESTYEDIATSLYRQHMYFNVAYVLFLSEHIRFKPSLLLKGVKGSPLSVDYNLFFNLNEKYTAGAFTRNFNTYGLVLQMKISDKYQLGYAFEVPSDRSVGPVYVSHEVTFGISLPLLSYHSSSIRSF